MTSGNALILNVFFPGVGTIAYGKQTEGIVQIVIYWLGLLFCFTIIGAIIGLPMMLAMWIWGLVCVSQNTPGGTYQAPQIVVNQHVGDVRNQSGLQGSEAPATEISGGRLAMHGAIISAKGANARPQHFKLSEKRLRCIIGRDRQGVDMVLDDPSVSRQHARLDLRNGKIWLVDLGSSNGTRLGSTVVGSSPVMVRPGDRVFIGSVALEIRNEG